MIQKSGKSITIDVVATGATVNEEISKVKSYYLGHQQVKGMFAVDGGTTQGVAETMDQYGLAAKGVHGGGFDLLPRTLELIRKGSMDFTIDQQPYLQGYLPVVFLAQKARYGLLPAGDVATGPSLIRKDQAGQVIALSSRSIR